MVDVVGGCWGGCWVRGSWGTCVPWVFACQISRYGSDFPQKSFLSSPTPRKAKWTTPRAPEPVRNMRVSATVAYASACETCVFQPHLRTCISHSCAGNKPKTKARLGRRTISSRCAPANLLVSHVVRSRVPNERGSFAVKPTIAQMIVCTRPQDYNPATYKE
jgi:hypothetical protein